MPSFPDPRERMQQRMARIQNYARNPLGKPRPRSYREQPFKLSEQQRESWLKQLGGATIGTLAKFGNVLDLPGSSVRDVAMTATGGGWHNPLDQWLPWNWTTAEGRATGRDLGRHWGMMGKKDTWGNLGGGIGLEIAMDPLLPLSFGLSAASKGGAFMKASGLQKFMPMLRHAAEVERGGRLGMREFMRSTGIREALRLADQAPLIKDVFGKSMREMTEEASTRLGFRNLDDVLARYGDEPFQGIVRYGLPDWKMFGRDPVKQLKSAPGKVFGLGEAGAKYGRRWDKAMDAMFDNQPMGYLRSLLDSSVQTFASPWTQRTGQMGKSFRNIMGEKASGDAGIFQMLVDKNAPAAINPVNARTLDEQLELHGKWRKWAERVDQAPAEVKPILEEASRQLQNRLVQAKAMGAKLDELDDFYLDNYFPRRLTETLKREDKTALKHLFGNAPGEGAADAAASEFMQRHMELKDIHGGTDAIQEISRDKRLHEILDKDKSMAGPRKYHRAARYIAKTYGPQGKGYTKWGEHGEKMRGKLLTRYRPNRPADIQHADQAKHVRIMEEAKAINASPLSDPEKAKMVRDLFERENVTPGSGWTGPELKPTDDLWEISNERYQALAQKVGSMSPEARQQGLFGNWVGWDYDKALGHVDDAIARSLTATHILADERAMRLTAKGGGEGGGVALEDVLPQLHMDTDTALRNIAELKHKMYGEVVDLDKLRTMKVNSKTFEELLQYNKLFQGPEATKWIGQVLDSFMTTFKANVTSPFPAFHNRNLISGQLRNVVGQMWSWRGFKDAGDIVFGGNVKDAASLPIVKQHYAKLQQMYPNIGALDDKLGTDIIRYMAAQHDVVGAYGTKGHRVAEVRTMGGGPEGLDLAGSSAGTSEALRSKAPGVNPFSVEHMLRNYFGLAHKQMRPMVDEAGKVIGMKPVRVKKTQTFATPFPMAWSFNALKKGYGKAAKKIGGDTAWGAKYADDAIFDMPLVTRTPGVRQGMALKGDSELLDETTKWFGPIEGGRELGHLVENQNRMTGFMTLLRQGMDPSEAAKRVNAAQIMYGAREFTSFENQIMKRLFPFWSFSSRSMPWAFKKFLQEPGNPLNYAIRGTKRTGEHLKGQYQHPGPVPPHIQDTLAVPLPHKDPGVKRFFTGMDLMSQDLWQLGMPLLSGDLSGAGYEIAGRGAPMWLKWPVESITGTSLFQRGVEGGRPLRNLDPPFGRAYSNVLETMAKAMGEQIPEQQLRDLERHTAFEGAFAASPYSRYANTIRTAFDPRKGLGAKAVNLLTGSKVQDISPRAQEAILREHLRGIIAQKPGGIVFEKATFSNAELEWLKRHNPTAYQEAIQLKALADERTRVAKQLAEEKARGMGAK